jgi:hypothetical protein
MSYADSLLSTGERIVHRERQHWFVMVWHARAAVVGLVLAIVLFVARGGVAEEGFGGTLRGLLGWLTLGLLVGGLAWVAWSYLRWQNQEYVITNRRVIQSEGVINKKATDSSLEKINDAALMQSWIGRIFGFGDLDVLTASEAGIERFRMLVHATDFKKAMLDAKYELEMDLARPSMPSAPLGAPGASSGPAVAAPGSAAQSAPAAPRSMSADEVTGTLDRLADLRDRGAISPAEYEAKKAELLGRL